MRVPVDGVDDPPHLDVRDKGDSLVVGVLPPIVDDEVVRVHIDDRAV